MDAPNDGIQTLARTNLLAWMGADQSRSQGFIARKIGISQPSVRGWVKGLSRPEPHLRTVIEVLTQGDVKASDWELESEREQRDDAIERIEAAQPNAAKGSAA